MHEHPLRRRYGLELALGGGLALAAIVLLVARSPRSHAPSIALENSVERAAETGAAPGAPRMEPGTATAEEARPGPVTRPGREAATSRGRPRVAVRVVDERGTPLAARRFAGWIDGPMPPPKLGDELLSDENGRLELEIPGPASATRQRILALRQQGPWYPEHGRVPLPAELDPARVTELGDLVLPSPPRPPGPDLVVILVSGAVQDEEGGAVAAADVWLRPGTPSADLRTTSTPEGFFTLAGPESAASGTLEISASGFLASRRSIDAVTPDLRITLRRAACFEARFLVDPGLPLHSLGIALVGPEGNLFVPFAERLSRCDLVPGEHALAVRTVPGGRVLARYEGIVLRPGANPCEPRFAPLDLRGRLARLEVRCVRDDGRPISGDVRAYLEPRQADGWFTGHGGRLLCVVPAHGRLALELNGYEPQFVWPEPFEQVLVFTPQRPK